MGEAQIEGVRPHRQAHPGWHRRQDGKHAAQALDGASGWDAYAAFYDWENARTFGRRDLDFWTTVLLREPGPALELGCGTGRLLCPLTKKGIRLIGLDRSRPMLAEAQRRARRLPRSIRPAIVRGDIRMLPYTDAAIGAVVAPYGLLQSLIADRDLDRALLEAARVLRRGGLFGIDLVPDLPAWAEYDRRVRLRGRAPDGAAITLVESVRQDRRRGLTIFDEQFVTTGRGRTERRRFSLTFRTRSVLVLDARLRRAGFQCEHVYGDYRGGPWHEGADAWVILCRKL